MQVFTLFDQFQVESVAQCNFVLSGPQSHARGISLVRVAEVTAVTRTTHKARHRMLRAVSQAGVKSAFLVFVKHARRDVSAERRPIVAQKR